MTPTQLPKSAQELRADEVFKIVGATGFLLNSFDQLDHLSGGEQRVFSSALRHSANRFRVELEKAEAMITKLDPTNTNMMQQMADSYEVVDSLMGIMLQAGRILSPESMNMLNQELMATAGRFGVNVSEK